MSSRYREIPRVPLLTEEPTVQGSAGLSAVLLPAHADAFLKSGLYLRNWQPRTADTYRQGLRCLYQNAPDPIPTKPQLDAWVVSMRERGLTPGGCNMYIRTVNSYLSWLQDEGHIEHRLKVKLLRVPLRLVTLLSSTDVRAIVRYRPCSVAERRTWSLILLLLDTGAPN